MAQHFLAADTNTFGSTATGFGARLVSGPGARQAVGAIAAHWGETGRAVDSDPVYRRVVDWIAGRSTEPVLAPSGAARKKSLLPVDIKGVAGWVGDHGFPIGRTPRKDLPQGAAYINSANFPFG